jgi:ATP-binding cassette ChvD family protein
VSERVIVSAHRLTKQYPPDRTVIKDISLGFFYGAKIGVLGGNGAGKSTLLRILAGEDERFGGELVVAPGIRMGLLPQEPALDERLDVRANVEEGLAGTRALLERFNAISAELADPAATDRMDALLAEMGDVQEHIDAVDGWNLDRTLDTAMEALRVPPGDADVSTLSGGERRRVALCRLLLQAPDVLLLDEPTNHLDAESVGWLERFLGEYPGTVIAVTHDRYFLDNVAQWILELDRGTGIPFRGNYSSWLEQKQSRLASEEKQESARRRALGRELEWARMTPSSRHQRTRARLNRYEALLAEESQVRLDQVEIHIPAGARLGDVVVEADGLVKGYGDRVLIDGLSFSLPPGGIVGVIGPNGAGKTTLFRMIAGQETPDSGSLRLGDSVELAYVDQSREDLVGDNTVWKEITGGTDRITVGGRDVQSRAYVASFNFRGSDQQKAVAKLSGGERNRLHLAKLLRTGGNLLLLDEPTNDLDVDTLRALEDALVDFAGCAVVISHDRWFLDRVATHMLAFEDEGRVTWFEGTYAEYEEHKRETEGEAALQPHRLRYKRLSVS